MKVVVLIGLLAMTSAVIAAPLPAPFMPKAVMLTAAANNFKKWQKNIPCSAGSYSTTITLSSLNPGAPYESAAQIILRVPSISGRAVFSIMTIHGKTPLRARLDITGTARDSPAFSQYAPRPLQPGKPINITFTWASTDGVQVVINGKDHLEARMHASIKELEIVGTGATARFDNNDVVCNLIS
jgi:hypothetical protein